MRVVLQLLQNTRRVAIVLAGVLLMQTGLGEAKTLRSLDQPIAVLSGVQVPREAVTPSLDFTARLPESLVYGPLYLPEGTEFVGQVFPAGGDWRNTHSAQVVIHRVMLPSGKCYHILANAAEVNAKLRRVKHNNGVVTFVDPGEPVSLRFAPYHLRGMMQPHLHRLD